MATGERSDVPVVTAKVEASKLRTSFPVRQEGDQIICENTYLRYVVSTDNMNRSFFDRTNSVDYLHPRRPGTFVAIQMNGVLYERAALSLAGDVITALFERDGGMANDTIERANALLTDIKALKSEIADSPKAASVPMSIVADSLDRTAHYLKDIGELVINYAIDVEGSK